jgi:hypothetical protein
MNWSIAGSQVSGTSITVANLFTVLGHGARGVKNLDLAVHHVGGTNSFKVSIWTDNNGVPGTQVANASWNDVQGLDQQPFGVVSITGISGVTLTGGQSYFLVVGPTTITSDTSEAFDWNNEGINGLALYSTDGGMGWHSYGTGSPIGAFEIIGN